MENTTIQITKEDSKAIDMLARIEGRKITANITLGQMIHRLIEFYKANNK